MKAAAILFSAIFLAGAVHAAEDTVAGVYRTESGIYSLTVTLLAKGGYLARGDGNIGQTGTAIKADSVRFEQEFSAGVGKT